MLIDEIDWTPQVKNASMIHRKIATITTAIIMIPVVFALAITVFIKSDRGDQFIHFLKETRIELRKVVWPTRQETIKTTGIIMVAVIIIAIFLWIVDAFFTWGVKSISSINIF
jgi:preprotein translocase subunit SecE